ncbi:hypothetical protein FRC11_009220 [Ceratobasidium sp. 423]|nr:hypothetical protein FRC11_009220 [Ceratobasidium sp. 423]
MSGSNLMPDPGPGSGIRQKFRTDNPSLGGVEMGLSVEMGPSNVEMGSSMEMGPGGVEMGLGAETGLSMEVGPSSAEMGPGGAEMGSGMEMGPGSMEMGLGSMEMGLSGMEMGPGDAEMDPSMEMGPGGTEMGSVAFGAGNSLDNLPDHPMGEDLEPVVSLNHDCQLLQAPHLTSWQMVEG